MRIVPVLERVIIEQSPLLDGKATLVLGPASLVLGPEPLIGRQQVVLSRQDHPEHTLRVGTDGLRPFAVEPPH